MHASCVGACICDVSAYKRVCRKFFVATPVKRASLSTGFLVNQKGHKIDHPCTDSKTAVEEGAVVSTPSPLDKKIVKHADVRDPPVATKGFPCFHSSAVGGCGRTCCARNNLASSF